MPAVAPLPAAEEIKPDPAQLAREAGLTYYSDRRPGYSRKKVGDAFHFFDKDGQRIKDEEEVTRIRKLAIPPAYTDVWICPSPRGHLQATGRDARGRKQYRYHAKWRATADETKYERMLAFAAALPGIRRRVARDLAQPGLAREKVLACIVRLLETTLIRVGNEEYAQENKSFGLTTLRNRHVKVSGAKVAFSFRGKSGVDHEIALSDPRLARVVSRVRDLPGQELFQYLDENDEPRDIDSADVNAYLQEITGQPFTAKDFRTWAGTVLAAMALKEFESFDSEAAAKKNIVAAIERVSERLGNTPSVCRKCYVHPEIFNAYLDGKMIETVRHKAEKTLADLKELAKLKPAEAAVVALLRDRLTKAEKAAK